MVKLPIRVGISGGGGPHIVQFAGGSLCKESIIIVGKFNYLYLRLGI